MIGSAALASSDNNPLYNSMSLGPDGQQQLWSKSIQSVVKKSPRLAEFANAVWNVHCDPQVPTHQYCLLSPHQKCDAPFPNLVPIQPLHNTNTFSWPPSLEADWKDVELELNDYLDWVMARQQNEQDRAMHGPGR